jgi:hypothetical protein
MVVFPVFCQVSRQQIPRSAEGQMPQAERVRSEGGKIALRLISPRISVRPYYCGLLLRPKKTGQVLPCPANYFDLEFGP